MKNFIALIFAYTISTFTFGQTHKADPLKLDGFSIYPQFINVATTGLLTLEFDEKNRSKTPFKIRLMRDGKVVSEKTKLTQIQLSEFLKYGKQGDFLIIESTDKNQKQYWRSIRIKNLLLEIFNIGLKDDGC